MGSLRIEATALVTKITILAIVLLLVFSILANIPVNENTAVSHQMQLTVLPYQNNTTARFNYPNVPGVDYINVGYEPQSIVFDPFNSQTYVANAGNNTVNIISSNNSVVGTIAVGKTPEGLTYDPNDHNIYVSNWGSDTLSVISSNTDTVNSTLGGFSGPEGAAFNPENGLLYVTNEKSDTVSVFNTSSGGIVTNVRVGPNPAQALYDPSNNVVYITNGYSDTVSVINSTLDVNKTITVQNKPFGMAYDPHNMLLYVADYGTSNVSIINTINESVVKTVYVGAGSFPASPFGIYYNSVDNEVYVSTASQYLSVIAPGNNTLVNTLELRSYEMETFAFAFDPQNYFMYVTDGYYSAVAAIPFSFNVIFEEKGLSNGSSWGVNLGGTNFTTNRTQITLPALEYGVHNFNVLPVTNYEPSINTSSVNLTGPGKIVKISYSLINNTTKIVPRTVNPNLTSSKLIIDSAIVVTSLSIIAGIAIVIRRK